MHTNRMRSRARQAALILLTLACGLGPTGCACMHNSHASDDLDALRAENLELRQTLESTRQALEASDSQRSSLESRLADAGSVSAAATASAAPIGANTSFSQIEGVETVAGGGSITVRVPGDILFDSGKADLKKGARSTLTEIAQVIKSDYADSTVRIGGHTDKDPIRRSRWKDNLELSSQRAMAVQRHLRKQGVDAANMYSAGYGSLRPRATKKLSRRVEIEVVLNE
ncbi:MAG: hypothetical protein CMJ18_19670 [Phycisphaeraceae bacterium]|nr:hypothetical protein [Phycisphaeraceae bacterium]